MGLIMRPTAVESPVDKNRQDFTIFSGKWRRAASMRRSRRRH
jgi:hypothetical protein